MNTYHERIKTIDNEVNTEHENALSQYKQRGQRDGKLNQPTSDFEGISPTESAIKSKYHGIYFNFKNRIDQIINEQEAEYRQIGSELNYLVQNPSVTEKQLHDVEKERASEILSEKDNHQHRIQRLYRDPDYIAKSNAKQATEEQFQRKSQELKRARPHIQGNWYWVILTILGTSEFMLNYDAFSSSGAGPFGTSIMALSAGVIFPVIAHFVSKIFRQIDEMPKPSIRWAFVALLLSIGLAYFLSWKRVQFAIAKGVIKDPTAANNTLIMFILLVMGIFVVGFLLSYFAHDPSPEFTNLFKIKEEARIKFEKEEVRIHRQEIEENTRHQTLLSQIKLRFDTEAKNIKNKTSNLHSSFKIAESNYESSRNSRDNIKSRINANYHSTIHSYREQNLSYRDSSNGVPKTWLNKNEDLDFNIL